MKELQAKKVQSILILEDNVLQARTLKLELTNKGYHVVGTVHSGIQAIKLVKRNRPDIALLDIKLNHEDLDGIDVGRAIHKIDENIILIYITAYDTENNFQRALKSMPYSFIKKPYKIRTVIRDIEMAIQKVFNKIHLIDNSEGGIKKEPSKKFKILCFPTFILINEGERGNSRIEVKDILYLQADNVWTVIQTEKRKNICITIGLSNFMKEMNYPQLIKIHRSYAINLDKIKHFKVGKTGGEVQINDIKIPVSRARVDVFWNAWNNYFGDKDFKEVV